MEAQVGSVQGTPAAVVPSLHLSARQCRLFGNSNYMAVSIKHTNDKSTGNGVSGCKREHVSEYMA